MIKRLLLPLVVFVILLGLVLFAGGDMPYFLLYILGLTYLLPLFHLVINFIGLKGYIDVAQASLFSGESIVIEYQVKNNSFLAIPYLEIEADIYEEVKGKNPSRVHLSLEKKQSYTKRETIKLNRRGYYQLGQVNIWIRDVFGFYSLRKTLSNETSLLVYPQIISLSSFRINSSQELGDLVIDNSSFQDQSRIEGLREYREGDPIKSIHWKLTAKRDLAVIKEFESRGDSQTVIYIDNYAPLFKNDKDRLVEDLAVDVALSIINYYLNNDIKLSFESQDGPNYLQIRGRHPSHIKDFLIALAKFESKGLADFSSAFMPRLESYQRASNIIVISPNLDKSLAAQLLQLKLKGLNPLLILVTDISRKVGYVDHKIERRLREEGMIIYNLDPRSSIKNVLEAYHG